MSFTVKTAAFEGPLDLLLELIEGRKLLINDVSLAQVTDDFIAHVRLSAELPMDESAHFILVASTLLLIKSKSLLPELVLSTDEQGDMRDLETRLSILKRIKDASKHVADRFGVHMIYPQSQSRPRTPIFAPDPSFGLERALASLKDLVSRLPKKESLPTHVVAKVVSLEEMIGSLTGRITSQLRMSFKQFTADHKESKVNVIVSFLAMLELVKEGILHVSQESHFGDITMETKDVGVPRY